MTQAPNSVYPITKLKNDLWTNFPEWGIDINHPNALQHALEALEKINDWRNGILKELVELHAFMEKERKESNGVVPVKGCYIFQEKLIELILGGSIQTVRQFLLEMGLIQQVESL